MLENRSGGGLYPPPPLPVEIGLIQKKDRNIMLIKNWRSISLINVDIKIASKALAFRVRKVLPPLIYYDQTAYVKGRYIGESIRLVDDFQKRKIVMEFCLWQILKKPLILLTIILFLQL